MRFLYIFSVFPFKGNTKYFSPVTSDRYGVLGGNREYLNTHFLMISNFYIA